MLQHISVSDQPSQSPEHTYWIMNKGEWWVFVWSSKNSLLPWRGSRDKDKNWVEGTELNTGKKSWIWGSRANGNLWKLFRGGAGKWEHKWGSMGGEHCSKPGPIGIRRVENILGSIQIRWTGVKWLYKPIELKGLTCACKGLWKRGTSHHDLRGVFLLSCSCPSKTKMSWP